MPRINYTVEQAMSTLRETDVTLSKGEPVVQTRNLDLKAMLRHKPSCLIRDEAICYVL